MTNVTNVLYWIGESALNTNTEDFKLIFSKTVGLLTARVS